MVVDTDKKRGKKREGKKRGVFFQHHSTTQKRTQHQKDVTRKNTHRHSFNLARDRDRSPVKRVDTAEQKAERENENKRERERKKTTTTTRWISGNPGGFNRGGSR